MLAYDFPLFRPPSEGDNLIIQATLGCSFNQCAFCSMYKSKDYRARPLAEVFADIDRAAALWPDAQRVFLADGDALVLPTDHLLALLEYLARRLPALTRVSAYATPFNLLKKSAEELQSLKAHKLSLVYVGIESGADSILKRIVKSGVQTMEAGLRRAAEGGLKVSATVILGLGGARHWQEHMEETAALINRVPPTYLSTLQLFLEPDVRARFLGRWGEEGFVFQEDEGILAELELLLRRLAPPRPVIFRSNHASNALALAGNLPKDSPRLLAQVAAARTATAAGDASALRPGFLRRL